jgi:hypothetical protein
MFTHSLRSDLHDVGELKFDAKSKYIGTRQQFYRSSHAVLHRFFRWCGGERVRREKEVVASRNNHLMNERTTSWDNPTTIVWVVVVVQLIIFFYVRKLKNYIDPPDDLPDNSLYKLFVKSTQDCV